MAIVTSVMVFVDVAIGDGNDGDRGRAIPYLGRPRRPLVEPFDRLSPSSDSVLLFGQACSP